MIKRVGTITLYEGENPEDFHTFPSYTANPMNARGIPRNVYMEKAADGHLELYCYNFKNEKHSLTHWLGNLLNVEAQSNIKGLTLTSTIENHVAKITLDGDFPEDFIKSISVNDTPVEIDDEGNVNIEIPDTPTLNVSGDEYISVQSSGTKGHTVNISLDTSNLALKSDITTSPLISNDWNYKLEKVNNEIELLKRGEVFLWGNNNTVRKKGDTNTIISNNSSYPSDYSASLIVGAKNDVVDMNNAVVGIGNTSSKELNYIWGGWNTSESSRNIILGFFNVIDKHSDADYIENPDSAHNFILGFNSKAFNSYNTSIIGSYSSVKNSNNGAILGDYNNKNTTTLGLICGYSNSQNTIDCYSTIYGFRNDSNTLDNSIILGGSNCNNNLKQTIIIGERNYDINTKDWSINIYPVFLGSNCSSAPFNGRELLFAVGSYHTSTGNVIEANYMNDIALNGNVYFKRNNEYVTSYSLISRIEALEQKVAALEALHP